MAPEGCDLLRVSTGKLGVWDSVVENDDVACPLGPLELTRDCVRYTNDAVCEVTYEALVNPPQAREFRERFSYVPDVRKSGEAGSDCG
jgi:hypothetical protein